MATQVGEMWMGHDAGYRTNHKENHEVRIPVSSLTPGIGQVQPVFKNAGGGDTSNLAPGDIPPGIIIECEGTEGSGRGWAVVKPYNGVPILSATDFDENFKPGTLVFTLGLYLHFNDPTAPGGHVRVKVYAA
ncbi:hypothetical protein G6L28_10385 [Agrobacterium larrymoorei]|uniref:hypothetical protein n=1 Tax=Agrobacterium larrymoorei TaxID=160699 RepID=UPI001572ABF3|nr:hypothetical protein [Agrobacterium larrymoorei]NTJ43002.1 hypothetical protein [Agrobacterium larrymoorei]